MYCVMNVGIKYIQVVFLSKRIFRELTAAAHRSRRTPPRALHRAKASQCYSVNALPC